MRFTRIVLYRAGSCKVCTPPLIIIMAGDNKTVKPTIGDSMMIAHQLIENKYDVMTSFLTRQRPNLHHHDTSPHPSK